MTGWEGKIIAHPPPQQVIGGPALTGDPLLGYFPIMELTVNGRRLRVAPSEGTLLDLLRDRLEAHSATEEAAMRDEIGRASCRERV